MSSSVNRHRRRGVLLAALPLAVMLLLAAGRSPMALREEGPSGWARPSAVQAHALPRPPLAFVPNRGQSHPEVRYQVQGWRGGMLYLQPEGLAIALPDGPARGADGRVSKIGLPAMQPVLQGSVTSVGMTFVGAAATDAVAIRPTERLSGRFNYLLGRDPAGWHTQVPSFAAVTYHGLYPGIDLRYDGDAGTFKGNWSVAPGADPSAIAWRYEGTDGISLDPASGDLRIAVPEQGGSGPRSLVEAAPVAWQTIGTRQVPVRVSFQLAADGTVRFRLGAYQRRLPLVIDPALRFATYLGGASRDWGDDIELDPAGNIYVAGGTSSMNFPTVSPLQAARGRTSSGYFIADAYVSKLSPDGQTLLYSTYLGGNEGPDNALGLAVDAAGSVALTGETHAADFPMANPFQAVKSGVPILPSPAQGEGFDGYVARLSADGSKLLLGSFYGGNGREEPQAIAYGPDGDLYVTGHTLSTDFPLVKPFQARSGGAHEAFVGRIDGKSYQLKWSSYLGGASSDMGWGLAVDTAGGVFIAGQTSSLDFPTVRPLQAAIGSDPLRTQESDMFLARVAPDGQALTFSTYLGGLDEDRAIAVEVERGGDAVFTGMSGGHFPLVKPYQSAHSGYRLAVVLKVSPDGQTLRYSTYLGGSGDDWGVDLDLDGGDNAWVAGRSTSADFPVKDPVQPLYGGANDTFVAALSPDGQSLLFSSLIGGSGHDMGLGIAVRPDGTSQVTGWTGSTDYPLLRPLQAAPGGGDEAFIFQIGGVALPPTPTAARPTVRPTPAVEPTPTRGPAGSCVCAVVRSRVPPAVIADALANPARVAGWGQALDPGKPPSPANPMRECLSLRVETLDFHPLFNTVVWKVGCR